MLKRSIRNFMIFLAALLLSGIASVMFMVVVRIQGLTHKDPKLELESHRYADAAIVAVIKNWNEDALLARGSSELTAAAEFEINLDSVFRRWRRLGPMVEYEGSSGKASVTFSTETGRIVTAVYIARASFQHGTARIKIGLVKRRVWKVASFEVFSSMLSTPAGSPPTVRKLISPGRVQAVHRDRCLIDLYRAISRPVLFPAFAFTTTLPAIDLYALNSSNRVLASMRSAVSKPSVNQL